MSAMARAAGLIVGMHSMASPRRPAGGSRLKGGVRADLEHRNVCPAQFFERVARQRNESLKQLAKAAKRPAKTFVSRGTERRVSPLAVGGKAHQHTEGVDRRHLDIWR